MRALLVLLLVWPSIARAYSLQGKRALVTGSSGGIGKAIALKLAEQGCEVIVHYHTRREGAIETSRLVNAPLTLHCDFREPAQIHDMFRKMDQVFEDGIDILVNNAGIVEKSALDDDTDDLQRWHDCLAVNLHAPRLLSHLAVPRMKRGGVILNVSSIHGEKSVEYMGAYAVSKSALDSLTRCQALEYAVHNIRVNAIAPGVVPVERTADVFSDEDVVNMWKEKIPLDRLGTVEEVAEACLPLLTNDWITGSIWQIDGGMMARANFPNRPRPLLKGGIA